MKKVFIYHPGNYLGGTEVLFSKLAIVLADKLGCQVTIVGDSSGCAVRRALGKRERDFNYMEISDKRFYSVLSGGVLVGSARNIVLFYSSIPLRYRKVQFRPVFWLVHPAELYAQIGLGYDTVKRKLGYRALRVFYRFNIFRFRFEAVLQRLNNSGSLFFMDRAVLRESEWVMSIKFEDPKFLHLVSGLSCFDKTAGVPSLKRLVLVSRIDSFKMPGILKLLYDLESAYVRGGWSGQLDIVGNGRDLPQLQKVTDSLSFQVNFAGYIPSDKLRDFIISGGYGVMFGMGLSLLEGASVGIPCLMLPASERKISCDECYVGLDPSEDSLGEYFDSPARNFDYNNLDYWLEEYSHNWEFHSQKSLDFFLRYFDEVHAVESLRQVISESKAVSCELPYIYKFIAKVKSILKGFRRLVTRL